MSFITCLRSEVQNNNNTTLYYETHLTSLVFVPVNERNILPLTEDDERGQTITGINGVIVVKHKVHYFKIKEKRFVISCGLESGELDFLRFHREAINIAAK